MKQLAKTKLKGNWGVALAAILIGSLISGAAGSVFGIGYLIVAGPLTVGICAVFVNIFRKEKGQLGDMGNGLNNFLNNMITGILVNVFIALWSLLFIIPGIVKSYSYAMTYYIQNDKPQFTETDAITESREIMRGHKWDLFVLDISFIGWYMLSVLTFGLLLLYVIPYHQAARTAFYEDLIGSKEDAAEPSESYGDVE
jgi:uncharacterized membrane protein